jgi:prephenate dehydratase
LRVAYLGPAGTFTEEALRASAPAGVDEAPYATVYEAVMAVQDGRADRAVVPIENSLEGSVAATLDALAGEAADVRIVAEVVQPVRHCLIARNDLDAQEIVRVLSHPQALAQCAAFLRSNLPGAEPTAASSTAEAVRAVADSVEPWAAVGAHLAAELYDCQLLAEGIEDRHDNETRFVWLARGEVGHRERASKTSVVFWGFNDQSPGALVDVLREFGDRRINLTKIESRPRPGPLGRYMFFADLDGGAEHPEVSSALRALGERVQALRVLGTYPAASAPNAGGPRPA